MRLLKLTLLVLNVIICVQLTAGGSQKILKFDRAMQCPGYKNYTLVIEKLTLTRIGKLYGISMKFKVLQNSSRNIKMRVELTRCRSREALDTCESIPDLTFTTICVIVNLKLPPFGTTINAIQPPIKCPMEIGAYVMTNNTIDEAALSIFPLDGWYWKIHTYFYDKIDGTDKMINCMYYECSYVHVA